MGAPSYTGNCDWRQITNPEWSTDCWGLDEATIQFSGRRDKCKAFEDTLTGFVAMPEVGGMYLRTFSTKDHRSFPIIDARYVGLRDGRLPDVQADDCISVQTVSTSGTTGTGKKISGEFTYRASRTNYQWIESSNPSNTPRFNLVRRQTNPIDNLISWRITDDTGKSAQVPYSEFVTLLNSLKLQVVTSDYNPADLVPGRYWGCKCTCDYVLIGS